ncbi:hypothetical protein HKD95_000585 [Salmonella enterica]|nr:hypothetical protein [Salmonella enterica]
MSDVNLTYDEIFGYLMKKSGRWLPGAPKIDLPYPLPAQSVGKNQLWTEKHLHCMKFLLATLQGIFPFEAAHEKRESVSR